MIKIVIKIFDLLSRRQRIQTFIILFLVFVGMFFEIFGLSVLVPVLELLSNEKSLTGINLLDKIIISRNLTYTDTIKIFLAALVFTYTIKTSYLIFLNFFQNKFTYKINSAFSSQLYQSYLNKEYKFHLENNSSELNKRLTLNISYFTSFCNSVIILLTEIALSFAISITIFYIEPYGATFTSILFVSISTIFYKVNKSFLKKWGNQKEKIEVEWSKTILDGLRSYKELLVLGKSDFFVRKFKKEKEQIANLITLFNTLNLSPRHFLELATVIALTFFIGFMLFSGYEIDKILPTIGVFVAATFRIIPSVNKIITSLQNINFHLPSVEIVVNELFHTKSSLIKTKRQELKFEKSINLSDIQFRYGERRDVVIDELNLNIKKGQTVGIIGSSGTGKSTLIDIILGIHKPERGEILIDNVKLNTNINGWRSIIGYVPQHIFLTDNTIVENIALGVEYEKIDLNRIKDVLMLSCLNKFIEELPLGLQTIVGEYGFQLSGGQRQRIGIARALYNNPKVLLFDEATSALDNDTEKEFMNLLYDLKGSKTIVIVAHRLSTLNKCDVIYKLDKGKLIRTK